jgi:hypothetical protein
MESDKKIGIASSKILYFYEDNTIQYAGITYKPYYLEEGITDIKK